MLTAVAYFIGFWLTSSSVVAHKQQKEHGPIDPVSKHTFGLQIVWVVMAASPTVHVVVYFLRSRRRQRQRGNCGAESTAASLLLGGGTTGAGLAAVAVPVPAGAVAYSQEPEGPDWTSSGDEWFAVQMAKDKESYESGDQTLSALGVELIQ